MGAKTVRRASLDANENRRSGVGNVIQAWNRMNPARLAAIDGGIPVAVRR